MARAFGLRYRFVVNVIGERQGRRGRMGRLRGEEQKCSEHDSIALCSLYLTAR